MKITIVGRQMNVYDNTKTLIHKKLSKLDKLFRNEAEAQVTLSRKHSESTVELTINSEGTLFRSEVGAATFQDALDQAMYAIERRIRKHKTRLSRRLREDAFDGVDVDYFAEDMEEEDAPVIRVKKFEFHPMSTEEAIMQMELLGHEFYVFTDMDTEATCVVYRRRDGTYGLIEPM